MSQTITINLPEDTQSAMDNAALEEGVSQSALIEKAVADYLFIRRLRSLRERLMSERKHVTDKDVFHLVW